MYMLWLFLMPLFFVERVISINPHCAGSSHYIKTSGNYSYTGVPGAHVNEISKDAKLYEVNDTHALITWDPFCLYPGMWDCYRVQWQFGWDEGIFGRCAFVPKNKTQLLVKREKLKDADKFDFFHLGVKVDIYPLPRNEKKFSLMKLNLLPGYPGFPTDYAIGTSCPNPTAEASTTVARKEFSKELTPETGHTPLASRSTIAARTAAPKSEVRAQGNKATWIALGVGLAVMSVVAGLVFLLKRRAHNTGNCRHGPLLDTHDFTEGTGKLLGETTAAPALFPGCRERTYVVSYWPENKDYIDKIASIVAWFREAAGYAMIMDKMATTEICSKGHVRWAELEIHKADKVLVFLSPGYITTYMKDEAMSEKSTDDQKRVWYEMQIFKSIYSNTRSANKMVCVLTDDMTDTQNLPPWAVITYRWPEDKEKILMRLNDVSEMSLVEVFGGNASVFALLNAL